MSKTAKLSKIPRYSNVKSQNLCKLLMALLEIVGNWKYCRAFYYFRYLGMELRLRRMMRSMMVFVQMSRAFMEIKTTMIKLED